MSIMMPFHTYNQTYKVSAIPAAAPLQSGSAMNVVRVAPCPGRTISNYLLPQSSTRSDNQPGMTLRYPLPFQYCRPKTKMLAVSSALFHYNKKYLHRDFSTESSEHVSSKGSMSSENSEYGPSEESTSSGDQYSNLCPHKEESLLSDSDIKYTIENIASKLQLEDNLQTRYLPDAEEVRDYYLKELKEFQQHTVDRPVHLLHILDDIVDTRHKIEPKVYDIMTQIQDSDILIKKYNDFSEQADILLQKLEKSKKICQLNCEYPHVESRFGYDIISYPSVSKHLKNKNMSCIRLQDLDDYVTTELSEFGENFDHVLHWNIGEKKETYENKLECLKANLKEAAVKHFGMTMYDILSLQDDYYHFEKYFQDNKISYEINTLEENTAQIKLKLIGLKRGVEKYRQYCMNCNSKQRIRRNLHDATELRYDYSYENPDENQLDRSNIIDILIKAKKDEILENFKSLFDEIFQELDAEFDDPEVIDVYVTKLEPIQHDIDNHIQEEQTAINELRTRIDQSEIYVILELLEDSNHLLDELESSQHFINQYI